MRKEKPTLCEKYLQFWHSKIFCRNNRELCTDCTESLQEGRAHNFGEILYLHCKLHKTGVKNICKEYKIETTMQNKMRLNAYTAKETLGYKGKNVCSSNKKITKKEENQWGTSGKTTSKINNQRSPLRRRDNHMEELNRVNEEKDINTHDSQ